MTTLWQADADRCSWRVDARHLNVDVDPVEQWAGDALLIARHHVGRAVAPFLRIQVIAAWAGMNTKRTF